MISTGHLPKFADDAYHLERDDLWAIPTSEVPLTSMFRNEILDEADLPAQVHGIDLVLPARGRCGRPRHPWPAPGARVRQGRALLVRDRRAGAGRPRRHPRSGDGAVGGARSRVPGRRPVRRRPRDLVCTHVRPRGVRPRLQHVARGLVCELVLRTTRRAGPTSVTAPSAEVRPCWHTP